MPDPSQVGWSLLSAVLSLVILVVTLRPLEVLFPARVQPLLRPGWRTDLCYFLGWGNLAFFHGSYESTRDLVRLGRLDSTIAPLLTRGEFTLHIETI